MISIMNSQVLCKYLTVFLPCKSIKCGISESSSWGILKRDAFCQQWSI